MKLMRLSGGLINHALKLINFIIDFWKSLVQYRNKKFDEKNSIQETNDHAAYSKKKNDEEPMGK